MKSLKRQLAGIATMVAATGSVMIVGTYTEAASAAGCPVAPSWRVGNNVRFNDAFVDDYSPVRVAPDADCARVGYGHRWHDINSHCFAQNSVGNWWLHLYNRDTADNGWVYINHLKGSVSAVYC